MATTLETVGRRIYFASAPFAAKDRIKGLGAKWDADKRQWWIGTAKKDEAEKLVAELNDPDAPKPKQSPDDIRLTGKGEYKGRTYYAGAVVGGRVRLLTLPDAKGEFLDFWADCEEVKEIKRYEPREVWDGRRGGGTVTKYTTLGSIADFIAKQNRLKASGTPECCACGKRSNDLITDLEDGLTKCRACCDIPSE